MNVKIQTAEDIYWLVWAAVAGRQPIRAFTKRVLDCSVHTDLGRNWAGQRRVLCYQFGGESESGLEPVGPPANWRCLRQAFDICRKASFLWAWSPAEQFYTKLFFYDTVILAVKPTICQPLRWMPARRCFEPARRQA